VGNLLADLKRGKEPPERVGVLRGPLLGDHVPLDRELGGGTLVHVREGDRTVLLLGLAGERLGQRGGGDLAVRQRRGQSLLAARERGRLGGGISALSGGPVFLW